MTSLFPFPVTRTPASRLSIHKADAPLGDSIASPARSFCLFSKIQKSKKRKKRKKSEAKSSRLFLCGATASFWSVH